MASTRATSTSSEAVSIQLHVFENQHHWTVLDLGQQEHLKHLYRTLPHEFGAQLDRGSCRGSILGKRDGQLTWLTLLDQGGAWRTKGLSVCARYRGHEPLQPHRILSAPATTYTLGGVHEPSTRTIFSSAPQPRS